MKTLVPEKEQDTKLRIRIGKQSAENVNTLFRIFPLAKTYSRCKVGLYWLTFSQKQPSLLIGRFSNNHLTDERFVVLRAKNVTMQIMHFICMKKFLMATNLNTNISRGLQGRAQVRQIGLI